MMCGCRAMGLLWALVKINQELQDARPLLMLQVELYYIPPYRIV